MNVKEFAKRKRVFPLLENEMGDRKKEISGEMERGRGGRRWGGGGLQLETIVTCGR